MSVRRLLLPIVLPLLAAMFVLGAAAPARADISGTNHHCGIKQPGGTVWCWGLGMQGQLGSSVPNSFDNPSTPPPKMTAGTPVVVPGVSNAIDVAVGESWTCALLASGSVQCWGSFALGDGNTSQSATPVTVSDLSDATAIAIGSQHMCALRTSGQVVCWGSNSHGQLGDGTTGPAATPVTVTGLTDVSAIGAGGDDSCAVLSDDSVRCWGRDDQNNLGDGGSSDALTPVTVSGLSEAASVGVQGAAVCIIQTDGDVVCAGAFYGSGTTVPVGSPARSIAFGGSSGCVLFTNGRVGCSGSNNSVGQFGDGTLLSPSTPGELVNTLGIEDATSLSMGAYTTCATHSNGDVSCWGFGTFGGTGTGHNILAGAPTPVPAVSGATEVTAGNNHACSLGSGQLSCWGSNGSHQIDGGDAQNYWSPVIPLGHVGALAVDTYEQSTCAVEADHSVSCWGAGSSLTSGGSALTDATSLAIDDYHACALRSGGTVSCWGSGGSGQLGNADTSDSQTPVDVTGISDATQITGGSSFNCALRSGGTIACWGYGGYGRLGNGDDTNSSTPVAVTGINDAVSIAAGETHVCAARASGIVSCWGGGPNGQLGNGDTNNSSTPVDVTSIDDAAAVAAGPYNSCAVRQNGAVACWGEGDNGQLAFDTDSADSSVAVAIPGITDAVAAAVGTYTVCALRSSGTVACWGLGDEGQLGDGFMPEGHGPQPTPHKVIGFGWDGSSNGGGGDTPPSTPDAPADPNPLTPPTLTPPAVTPPVRLPPAEIEALLAGKRIAINAQLKLRKGQRCTGTVTATTAFGTTTYRVSLKLKPRGAACRATGTIKLKKAPTLRTKLRITISGKPIKTRSLTTKRS